MAMLEQANWIRPRADYGEVCPLFRRKITVTKPVRSAVFQLTVLGVYEATLNGARIGNFILAPGWTSYQKRLQVQCYDVTALLKQENELCVNVGKGWCVGRLVWENSSKLFADQTALIGCLTITYEDGTILEIPTDATWETAKSSILMSEIYDGETVDARIQPNHWESAEEFSYPKEALIPQEGEPVTEQESFTAQRIFLTPKGERVIDFGQNLTGYVSFRISAKPGDRIVYTHAEILDKDGNFYTDNLRTAQNRITYLCAGGEETYKPHHTFQGFRYIRIDEWPDEPEPGAFRAIAVHSQMNRTGWFECSSPLINQLYHNIVWGQKGNFLDVPTDCPQRDERLGWTGDAQAFVRTAAYNYDVERFFRKWLHDVRADQFEDGSVPNVVPNVLGKQNSSAWGDAASICTWQIYQSYGNPEILADQFDSMKKLVDYVRAQGNDEFLWNTGFHFGDWLALDGPDPDKCDGGTDTSLIATAFYANSTDLLVKAGKVLGKDMTEYEALYRGIVQAFRKHYCQDGTMVERVSFFDSEEAKRRSDYGMTEQMGRCDTQTAHVLALHFKLTENPAKTAAGLAKLVQENGEKLATGFLGTPYLLHVLADNGYAELAYTLLFREEYPSWLYSVKQGATTVWEHWDGMRPDGTMWSPGMNSFNHYAYGAVGDFLYGSVAGIQVDETVPAYQRIQFKPVPDSRLSYAKAALTTRYGTVESGWKRVGEGIRYEICIPEGCTGELILPGEGKRELSSGRHTIESIPTK